MKLNIDWTGVAVTRPWPGLWEGFTCLDWLLIDHNLDSVTRTIWGPYAPTRRERVALADARMHGSANMPTDWEPDYSKSAWMTVARYRTIMFDQDTPERGTSPR